MHLYPYVLTSVNSFGERSPEFLRRYVAAGASLHEINRRRDDDGRSVMSLSVVWGMNSERFERVPKWREGSTKDRRGHTACYWGHVQMWRQALAEHDDDFTAGAAIFFEDDAWLDQDFWPRAFQGYDELPDDWDVLYFGGQHCVNGRRMPAVASEHLYRLGNVNRLHAYSIRLSSLPKIILWFSENHDWGHNFHDPKTGKAEAEVDYALGSLTESGFLNGYALRQWACSQGAFYSWTQGVEEKERRFQP